MAELVQLLKQMLQVGHLFFLPQQTYDMTGHADGMVRFLNPKSFLISDYQNENRSWKRRYEQALKNTGLEIVAFPSLALNKKNEFGDYTARIGYINFAHIGNKILLP